MENILNVIRVRRGDSRDGLAVEVDAELRLGASMNVSHEMAQRHPGSIEWAEDRVVSTLLRALYGDLEDRLQEIGHLAIASAADNMDAMRIARGFREMLDIIGSKQDEMRSMVVPVVNEGVGYPELYFNENRETFTNTGE